MATTMSKWPSGYQAAVSITLDNMGEAADIQRGTWPAGKSTGSHFSVTDSLPNILSLFDELGARSTYFVEGWNAFRYPDAIRNVRRHGHEVALHGWQHEKWNALDRRTEDDIIARGAGALRDLELEITGFRPPGGVLTDHSTDLLRAHGIDYCSPAGTYASVADGFVYLPFAWQAIDAYYYLDSFAGLREVKGDSPDVLAPSDFAERAMQLIHARIETGGYLSILFHPFLETEPERIAAMIEIIRGVLRDDRIWCAPCREVAEWIRARPDLFDGDPGLDTTEWSR